MVTYPIVKMNGQWFGVAVLAAAGVMGCSSTPPDNTPQTWETPRDWAMPSSTNQASLPPTSSPTNSVLRDGTAIARSVTDGVEVASGGAIRRIRTNMELAPRAIIKTTDNAQAYLQVNGFTSTVKVEPSTVVELTRMEQRGGFIGGDSYTVLTLKVGSIICSVRKLSADSLYEISTPNGVARIRGTDFAVAAKPIEHGKFQVTYTAVAGQIVVSAMVNGVEVTEALNTGQAWVPGEGDVRPMNVQDWARFSGPPIPLVPWLRSSPPPLPDFIQPFNGNGPPNPAVDAGQNPYAKRSPPIPHPLPPPIAGPFPTVSPAISAGHR